MGEESVFVRYPDGGDAEIKQRFKSDQWRNKEKKAPYKGSKVDKNGKKGGKKGSEGKGGDDQNGFQKGKKGKK